MNPPLVEVPVEAVTLGPGDRFTIWIHSRTGRAEDSHAIECSVTVSGEIVVYCDVDVRPWSEMPPPPKLECTCGRMYDVHAPGCGLFGEVEIDESVCPDCRKPYAEGGHDECLPF